MREKKMSSNRLIRVCEILAFILIPALTFYLMEAYEHNPFAEVRAEAQLFNILLFELLAWILYFVTNRMHWALRIELVLAMVFGLVNHYVMQFRSTPFVPWDIYSIGTAASVAGNYDFTPGTRVIVVTVVFVLLMICVGIFRRSHEWQKAKNSEDEGKKPFRPYYRWPMVVLFTGVLCLFTNLLQNEQFQIRHYLYPFLFTPAYMTEVNGMAVTFAMNLAYIAVDKPDGYDEKEAEQILSSYCEAERGAGKDEGKTEDYPNIIVIMDEAFSDLAVLGDFETNEDYMPFYHELQRGAENTVTGQLQVSVCGGNTANSEFEFLTGNTMAFLPAGSIPYQQYVKQRTPSLAEYLGSLGYETYAQHPYYASGWDREKVYPLLGFSDMDFIDDYENKSYVRKYVSDASDFSHVIRTFENKKEGSPAFIFNVTMQNHGGYTEEYRNFSNDVEADCGTDALNQYLSLIRLTDESLRELIQYFSEVDEKTLIVFFGDHQPSDTVVRPIQLANGIDSSNLTEAEQAARYQVPYLIWANFGIAEEKNLDMSVNYLGANVLKLAGVPTGAYQNFLLELQKSYPILSASLMESADVKKEEQKERLLMYQKLQYYNIFDAGEP